MEALKLKVPAMKALQLNKAKINYQWTPEQLKAHAVKHEDGVIADNGALAINTGLFTGRSPQDRFFVKDEITKDRIWWDGTINLPFDKDKFDKLKEKLLTYLNERDEIFVRDCYACAHPDYKIKVRAITQYAWSNLFIYNMFIRPTAEQLGTFGEQDWLILDAPGFHADPKEDGTKHGNFAILDFTDRIALVGGTGYTGEMKKGIFSALNFILPSQKNVLSMHCSANIGDDGNTALFFGLSGTGKTTLSADPNRKLIGDDEHGWTPNNEIFNFEGGCYAKVIGITQKQEPEIWAAIKDGALLENVCFHPETNTVNYYDTHITQNTRVSYPLYHIDNREESGVGKNPRHIFFLTYDAFGVLPPIAKLSPGQAAYHFISGYTSKVAGTEEGINEPVATYSACFGAPFMPLHPTEYATMLSNKMRENEVSVWLVNTGLNGTGKRMSLKTTRGVLTAALNSELDNVPFEEDAIFGFHFPKSCPGVDEEHLLNPINSWKNPMAYVNKALKLAKMFKHNFEQFEDNANEEIIKGGPKI